jgi:FkbM family methyltransferase
VPVYAVESNAAYCESIRNSVVLNGFDNVGVFNAALSDRSQTARVKDVTVSYGGTDGVEVTTVTLDDLCERENLRPTVVKMDVHGAEGKILQGMEKLMSNSVQYVFLELHPFDDLDRYSTGMTRDEILAVVRRMGFDVYMLAGHRTAPDVQVRYDVANLPFTYRPVTEDNQGDLLFDRTQDVLLLLSNRPDVAQVLGPSVSHPLFD